MKKTDSLLKKFEEIHNYIYANDGLSPQQTLEEVVKILFIKIYAEHEKNTQFVISSEEWKSLKLGREPQAIVERVANLFEQAKIAYQDIFESDDRIRISPIALGFTINKLQNVALVSASQDAKGLAFQKFLAHHEKDGSGQFFTPEPVMDFCVEMLQPKPNDTIIDPACGSGGFLMSALKYLQRNYAQLNVNEVVENNLFGADINKSIARIAKMKLLLEANGKTNIICANSLEGLDSFQLSISHTRGFDLVLANPPFGAKITNIHTLSKFDLGYKWSRYAEEFHKTKNVYANQNAEILFIERCLHLLKEGGRMAIVLPNGNFENPSLAYLRNYIKLNAKILAVVTLPSETFLPFGTGVKTSILFLQKDTISKTREYSIFFARILKLGYQGNKNATPIYQKDKNGQILKDEKGKAMLAEDFSALVEAYKMFQKGLELESENYFTLPYSNLKGRFDFDFYSPANRQLFALLAKAKTLRLGDICEIVKGKSKKLKDPNLRVEYVELSDVNAHSYEIINSTTFQVHELPSRATYEIKEGDIITSIAGNSVGTRKHATALVMKDFEGSICTNGFRVLRNVKIDIYYLLYFFKTEIFLKQMMMYRTGAAIPNVSDADFANTLIYLPSTNEIKMISDKMKRAFDLRQESRNEMESIELSVISK